MIVNERLKNKQADRLLLELYSHKQAVPLNPAIAIALGGIYSYGFASGPQIERNNKIIRYLQEAQVVTSRILVNKYNRIPQLTEKPKTPSAEIADGDLKRYIDLFTSTVLFQYMGLPSHQIRFGDSGALPNDINTYQFIAMQKEIEVLIEKKPKENISSGRKIIMIIRNLFSVGLKRSKSEANI